LTVVVDVTPMSYRVGVIGTGPGRDVDISGRAHSWAYKHADAYTTRDDCSVVACADLVYEYAQTFADEFGVPEAGVYDDHVEMLAEEDLDVVSVVTPITTHAEVVIDCARGSVQAVHCEKPMARTWAGARAMAQVCGIYDTQLTIAHQRRFSEPVRETKRLLKTGEVGDLDRLETSFGNFFDNGTHAVDIAGYLVDEARGSWVLGQVDYTVEHVRYGVPHAKHAFVSWQYENGVHGISATGDSAELSGGPFEFDIYDCAMRVVGTDGVIEITGDDPGLRVRRDGGDWETVGVDPEFLDLVDRGVDDAVDALDSGRDSELRAANALNTAEILLAGHESSRRRGRVELPLTGVYDHPLESLIEDGEVVPELSDDRPPHPSE
jgi:predicted dehydrogenase